MIERSRKRLALAFNTHHLRFTDFWQMKIQEV